MRVSVLAILLVLAASGCVSYESGTGNGTDGFRAPTGAGNGSLGTENPASPSAEASQSPSQQAYPYKGAVLAGTSAKLYDFNKADYDAAIAGDKLVVLYFYATWCPICAAELPHLYGAFDELERGDVVGFRANFNDGDTDDSERALASRYGVAYQHTKVFVKNGARVLKAPDSWQKERYLAEINKYAG